MAERINKDIINKVKDYLKVLVEHNFSYESAWLFGSFTQNADLEDSDIDIAMVMPEVKEKFFKELELTKLRRNIDYRIEPHILNSDDIDTPFYEEIVSKGIRIV